MQKLNVHKYKGLKTEHENSKLGHYMKGFILKQEISLIVNQKKKKRYISYVHLDIPKQDK